MTPPPVENIEFPRSRLLGDNTSVLPTQEVHLTNGPYTVHLSALGSGYSERSGVAISRWSGDKTCDVDGFHIFLRDLEDNFVWSASYQPTRVEPDEYEFCGRDGLAIIRRIDRELECRLTVCVAPAHDCELRLCRLTNHGLRARRIELTSYLEWVIAGRDADANHPAFSKLFVETHICRERSAILARRRPRSGSDPQLWAFHAIVSDGPGHDRTALQYETSRVAFIGRGRTADKPQAMDTAAALTGESGPVLDPIASLRSAIDLAAGETREVAFVLGAMPDRAEVEALLDALGSTDNLNALFGSRELATIDNGNGATHAGESSFPGGRIKVHASHAAPNGPLTSSSAHGVFEPAAGPTVEAPVDPGPLQFDNGFGGFSQDGSEYVIRVRPGCGARSVRPPMPWVNVVANEHAGFLVSESGSGYTWAGNSRLNRLTTWHNDPVCDPPSESIWIRDEDEGVFWSVTPGPTPAPAEYIVRHGFGYTTFQLASDELLQTTTMFMTRDEPVKLTQLRLENRSSRIRRLTIFSHLHWALGGLAVETADAISTTYDADSRAILATNHQRERYGGSVAFSAVQVPNDCVGELSCSCDRSAFLGRVGDIHAPAALREPGRIDGRPGGGIDSCAAWQLSVELPPNGAWECTFLLGEAVDKSASAALIQKYRREGQVELALGAVKDFWRSTVSSIEIESPDHEVDLVVNGWLTYQNLSCRMWGRSAFYQPGGAFGFRDQLQDSAALLYVRPDLTRAQIIRHAGQQFVEGDVMHWWHPDTGYGLRTRFSDDLLWLPYVAALYAETTGDDALWDENAPFVVGPALGEEQDEVYLRPSPAGVDGTIYEHCCLAMDRGLTTGPHGLPLIGSGDWNDGMNRVGRLGMGESVWLGFFIHFVLGHLLPICELRGDDQRVSRYTAYRDRLARALNADGWDGAWYRRAYYDNGQPLGSASNDECQIDALAQAWAVISGVASSERASMAMNAVDDRLVSREDGIIRLLTPAFNQTTNDPGYIKGYLPGIRENGGQYTHGVLWVVRAMAELGRGTTAVDLLRMLSPVWHTSTPERTAVYQTEPYVVAADVYGEPPHVGRGGWTWYTGSAGWMFRVAVESIFGFKIERGRTLVLQPSISSSWRKCRLTYRLPGETTRYEIAIENPHGKESIVTNATLDGDDVDVVRGAARVPLVHDGGVHRVVVWL